MLNKIQDTFQNTINKVTTDVKNKKDTKETSKTTKNTSSGESTALVDIVTNAIQVPGVKVDRKKFLAENFADSRTASLESIIKVGPVEAGISREELKRKAEKIIITRTVTSSAASFAAGLPGGVVGVGIGVTADTLQYFAVALRLAQELSYLYGEDDLWKGDVLDRDMVVNRLIIYCGVMFGVAGAGASVRVGAKALAATALKRLPQKALTKTFYYPIVKSIAKAFGVKMTKGVFAKGVSKAIPIIGGVISGGITFFSMRPQARKLAESFETANFSYTQEMYDADINEIKDISERFEAGEDISDEMDEYMDETEDNTENGGSVSNTEPVRNEKDDKILKTKSLYEMGIITEEEYNKIINRLENEEKIKKTEELLKAGIITQDEFDVIVKRLE